MNRNELISIIYQECEDINGFLVNLRGRRFLCENYLKLIQALREYREMIRGQDWIERRMACCLYYLDITVVDSKNFYPRTDVEKELIRATILEISPLIAEILTPEEFPN